MGGQQGLQHEVLDPPPTQQTDHGLQRGEPGPHGRGGRLADVFEKRPQSHGSLVDGPGEVQGQLPAPSDRGGGEAQAFEAGTHAPPGAVSAGDVGWGRGECRAEEPCGTATSFPWEV